MSINQASSRRLSPEFTLLGFLYRQPDHGYRLHKRLTDEFGMIWHSSQSQTYNILKRLAAQGYITSTAVEQEKLPDRQMHEITPKGADRFTAWLDTTTKSSVHALRVEFITRLYFMQIYHPEKTREMVNLQMDAVGEDLHKLREQLAGLPDSLLFNRLALELRITLLRSVIDWLEKCFEKVENGK